VAVCSIALLAFSIFSIRDLSAAQIVLGFVPNSSTLTWGGFFNGQPFLPQSAAGTTDYNVALASNKTTHQGTILVDVDNLLSPSTIQLIHSGANSDASGKWLPEDYAFLNPDVDGDGDPYEFPDDASSSVGTTPGAAADADYAIEINPGADVAYSALRDVKFNITTGPGLPVNGLGEFNTNRALTTENIELTTGWWDYWLHPTFVTPKFRQRLEAAGDDADNSGDDDNDSATGNPPTPVKPSTYVATPLGGDVYQITLTIPVKIDFPDPTAPTFFFGTLVATATIPEPTSFVLLGTALVAALGIRCRK
jgi:hypothetical protein